MITARPIQAMRIAGTLPDIGKALTWLGEHTPRATVWDFGMIAGGLHTFTVNFPDDADLIAFKMEFEEAFDDRKATHLDAMSELAGVTHTHMDRLTAEMNCVRYMVHDIAARAGR